VRFFDEPLFLVLLPARPELYPQERERDLATFL
jgi:hypothetical protein